MSPSELDAAPTAMLLDAIRRRLETVERVEADSLGELPVPDLEVYRRLQDLVEVVRSAAGLLHLALGDLDGAAVAELGGQHAIVARRHSELQRLYQVRLEVTRAALDRAAARPVGSQSPVPDQASGSESSGGRNQAPV